MGYVFPDLKPDGADLRHVAGQPNDCGFEGVHGVSTGHVICNRSGRCCSYGDVHEPITSSSVFWQAESQTVRRRALGHQDMRSGGVGCRRVESSLAQVFKVRSIEDFPVLE